MVKNTVKVYARLKREKGGGGRNLVRYEIENCRKCQELTLCGGFNGRASMKFRFHKIFDQTSSQVQVFDTIAKPVVNSTLNGYNGTIFAYGQTGSGKTYAITGSPSEYDERGIIPRSVQHVFEHSRANAGLYTIHISYMEIYRETAYDLLNPKHHPSSLEDLPRVVLLEDAKGETHLRNLSVLPVSTEQEAMRLLFLGDTNRTIAETPSNECSSRSHCIFTIYVTTKGNKTGRIRRSKLNLVDLAGSERVHKSKISGTALEEAKHINLSLHYLEQVILALSQTKRSHIPYRNSMMTYLLRDSLSGNGFTIMLATLGLHRNNFDETISTCKFAQRVSMMNTEAKMNEEVDPQEEIALLREEVLELRKQLSLLRNDEVQEKLSKEEEQHCKDLVKSYVKGEVKELDVGPDARRIQLCFGLLKKSLHKQQSQEENKESRIRAYEELLHKKEEEIQQLRKLLDEKITNRENRTGEYTLNPQEQEAFQNFIKDPNNTAESEHINQQLNQKYEVAKSCANTIVRCQKTILAIRKSLEANSSDYSVLERLNTDLIAEQFKYQQSINKLEDVRRETDHLKHGLEQVKIKLVQRFRDAATKRGEEETSVLRESGKLNRVQEIRNDCTQTDDEKIVTKDCDSSVDDFSKWAVVNEEAGARSVDADAENRAVADKAEERRTTPTKRGSKGKTKVKPVATLENFFEQTDSQDFIDFMYTVPLTGDEEVDDEIFKFYRLKFNGK